MIGPGNERSPCSPRWTAHLCAPCTAATLLLSVVACGAGNGAAPGTAGRPAETTDAAPDEAPPVVCLPPGGAPPSGCVITGEGARLPQLTVRPEGSAAFDVDVEDVAVDVAPADRPECVPVHVRGRLEFDATGAQIALRPIAATDVESGMVTLSDATRLLGPVDHDGDVAVGVAIADDVTLSPVVVPCAALAIDVPFRFIFNDPSVAPLAAVWEPRVDPFTIHELPGQGRTIEVHASAPVLLPFTERERSGDFLRLELVWTDGAALRGWAHSSDMQQTTAGGYGGDPGGGEPHGHGHSGCGGPGRYCGPADVEAGTPVFAEPGIGRWATVLDGRGVDVMLVEGEEYAAVRENPGIAESGESCQIRHAWVPAAAVTPTPDATPNP
jgi:hypothetical protein